VDDPPPGWDQRSGHLDQRRSSSSSFSTQELAVAVQGALPPIPVFRRHPRILDLRAIGTSRNNCSQNAENVAWYDVCDASNAEVAG